MAADDEKAVERLLSFVLKIKQIRLQANPDLDSWLAAWIAKKWLSGAKEAEISFEVIATLTF